MLTINVVTLFPEVFEGPLRVSILGRAAERGLVRYRVVQLRDYTHDRHKTVDDSPYGGGAGMVLKPEPFFEAVEDLRTEPPIVLLSARGRSFGHRDSTKSPTDSSSAPSPWTNGWRTGWGRRSCRS